MAQGLLSRFTSVVSGTPLVINTLAEGNFTASAVLVINYGTGTDMLGVTVEGFPGDPIVIAPGQGLAFKGQFSQFSVDSNKVGGVACQFIAAANPDDVPTLTTVFAGSGGGGGSGAPSDAKYLLFTDAVPAGLTNAETAAALQSPLDLVLPLPGSPDLTTEWNPGRLSINANGDDFLAGGGVKLPFRVLEGSGDHEFGAIGFRKSSTATDLHVTGAGAQDLFDYECVPSVGGAPAGLVMWGGNDRRIAAAGGNDLVVESTNAAVRVKTNGNEVVRFSSAHMDAAAGKNLTIKASASHDLTLVNGGGTAGININDDVTTPIQIITAGGGWGFNADGTLNAPSKQLKGLVDGTLATDAATVGQIQSKRLSMYFAGDGLSGAGGTIWSSSVAQFCPLGSTHLVGGDGQGSATVESVIQFPAGAVIRSLVITPTANTLGNTGADVTFQLRRNSATPISTMAVVIDYLKPTGASYASNPANTETPSAGDYYSLVANSAVAVDAGVLNCIIRVDYTI